MTSRIRAFFVSSLLATAILGGVASTGAATEAVAPLARDGSNWCC